MIEVEELGMGVRNHSGLHKKLQEGLHGIEKGSDLPF